MIRLPVIEKKAKALGVMDTWKYSKKELIRLIQKAEGNNACFSNGVSVCEELACCWRMECVK